MSIRNERGVAAVIVAVFAALLFAFGTLAVDVGHLYLTRNELQNAADACALAGARILYNDDGTAINTDTNEQAHDAGETNESQKSAVEINWTGGNEGDVQRGHWDFSTRTFTASDSTDVIDLWNASDEELNANTDFINAVRCVARRQATPVTNFLAPVLGAFGGTSFATSVVLAEAVAVRGFAGSLEPGEVDQPIALCSEKLRNADGEYSCSIGRMLNDGNTEGTSETAMWTDFAQSSNCSASSASSVRPLICGSGNPTPLNFGENIDSTNGTTTSGFDDFVDCWKTGLHLDSNGDGTPETDLDADNDGWPDSFWEIDLPVVNCGNNDPCTPLVGTVTVNVVWVVRSANLSGINKYDEAPAKMGDWTCSTPTPTTGDERQACWSEFVTHFNLKNSDDAAAPYASKSIYFVPDCTPHEPLGHTGGENFGITAKYPALVR